MAEKDTSAQRLKLLYLRDIFQKFTSETEALTRNQITDILLDYGITEGRKAFSEDVEALQKYGMDIRMTMGRTASYQLMTRDFELAELKLREAAFRKPVGGAAQEALHAVQRQGSRTDKAHGVRLREGPAELQQSGALQRGYYPAGDIVGSEEENILPVL